jgi:hypothetical protein
VTRAEETYSFVTASEQTTSYETSSEETTPSEDITNEAHRRRSFIEGLALLNSEFDDEDREQYITDTLDEWFQQGL